MKARPLFWTAGGFLAVGLISYLANDGGELAAAGLALLFLVFGLRARSAEAASTTTSNSQGAK